MKLHVHRYYRKYPEFAEIDVKPGTNRLVLKAALNQLDKAYAVDVAFLHRDHLERQVLTVRMDQMASLEGQERMVLMDHLPRRNHIMTFALTVLKVHLVHLATLDLKDSLELLEFQEVMPMEEAAVHLVLLGLLVHLDQTERLEMLVHPVHPDVVLKYQVQMDHLDHLDRPDLQVLLGIPEKTEFLDMMAPPDSLVSLEHQVQQVRTEQMV